MMDLTRDIQIQVMRDRIVDRLVAGGESPRNAVRFAALCRDVAVMLSGIDGEPAVDRMRRWLMSVDEK